MVAHFLDLYLCSLLLKPATCQTDLSWEVQSSLPLVKEDQVSNSILPPLCPEIWYNAFYSKNCFEGTHQPLDTSPQLLCLKCKDSTAVPLWFLGIWPFLHTLELLG